MTWLRAHQIIVANLLNGVCLCLGKLPSVLASVDDRNEVSWATI